MDTVISIIMSFQFSIMHIAFAGIVLFIIGYLRGKSKVKKLYTNIIELEKSVQQLNEELLYGKRETPVIEIQLNAPKTRSIISTN
jgi:hypothetical protein